MWRFLFYSSCTFNDSVHRSEDISRNIVDSFRPNGDNPRNLDDLGRHFDDPDHYFDDSDHHFDDVFRHFDDVCETRSVKTIVAINI